MDASGDTIPMHVLPGGGRVVTDGTVIRRERMIERPGRARACSICYYPSTSRTRFGTASDHDREEFPNELE